MPGPLSSPQNHPPPPAITDPGIGLPEKPLYQRRGEKVGLALAEVFESSLRGADLYGTNLSGAMLDRSDFTGAKLSFTTFADLDLSVVKGLERVVHRGPSSIGADTLRESKGRLPESFLRGCGLSDWEVTTAKLYAPDLTPEQVTTLLYQVDSLRSQAVGQINPIFISYNHEDRAFVAALETLLDRERIRYWSDVHELEAGRLERQLERAIALNPTVLLVLSKNSVRSDWVEWEVSKARELERKLGRDVLCPVALDDAWKTADWSGPLRRQIERYYIVDFSNWQREAQLRSQFERLRQGLQRNYRPPAASVLDGVRSRIKADLSGSWRGPVAS